MQANVAKKLNSILSEIQVLTNTVLLIHFLFLNN